jgi:DNA-binding transcriptional regulator LsrR (DeoR family)
MESLGSFPQCDVVQLIGGTPAIEGALQASELLGRIGSLTSGQIFALQAPMILPDQATALGLRSEESISRTLAAISTVDIAVAGIGAWHEGTSRVFSEFNPRDRKRGTHEHVVADVCGVFVDAGGQTTAQDLSDRMISADASDFAAIPLTVGMARGDDKVQAIDAVMRSGILNVLATDSGTADSLIRL